MSNRQQRRSGLTCFVLREETQGNGRRRQRLRNLLMEMLEDRRVLANQIVLDFSPDFIDSEYQVERFPTVFSSEPLSVSNQFLDYNSDGMISTDDAEIALHRISARGHRLLKPYREHADIDLVVWKSTDLANQVDPGAGETRLASGQASSSLNTYVIYVGNHYTRRLDLTPTPEEQKLRKHIPPAVPVF